MDETMSAIMEAAANDASPASDASLHDIIECGKKALRDKRSDELTFDLFGLDGVRLPLKGEHGSRLISRRGG
jgi:hypothetical protein